MEHQVAQALDRAAETALVHADRMSVRPGVLLDGSLLPVVGAAGRAAGLQMRVSQVDVPTELGYQRYVPSLSVVLVGRKRSIVGDDDQEWGREHFLITPVDLPVVAGVTEVDADRGFVSIVWRLDPVVVGEVVASMSRSTAPLVEPPRLGAWTAPLADAFARLVGLLDAPEDVPVLFPLLSREVVLRLLQTDQAPRILAALDNGSVVARATALMNERLDEPWSMERLAETLHASASTMFTRFKQTTGMSPAQYLKRARLGEARRRMVVLGETAARAAAAVGYRSASHFSRDYREAYGRPPAEDAAGARQAFAAGFAAAG
jgi:AraC-like DNA-binding protein